MELPHGGTPLEQVTAREIHLVHLSETDRAANHFQEAKMLKIADAFEKAGGFESA